MVKFDPNWYNKFVQSTNEKDLLVNKISDILAGKPHKSCLEIGLGTSPYFAQKLSQNFVRYLVVECRIVEELLPSDIELLNDDWENVQLGEKFDVIIASHVIYYFKNKKSATEKIFSALNNGGRVIFVMNGKESDYGLLKSFFSKLVNEPYKFTYDELLEILKEREIKEYTLPSEIRFSSFDELFDTLRLSFDNYPNEYQKLKPQIIEYFKKNIRGGKFIIDQKIIEIQK
ncbi:methyltransferase domain-containing protein [Patescibacteria group bacterium]|nr:MAG: methyltransferase domain-containing protein [Patescibacteria group bacterium]